MEPFTKTINGTTFHFLGFLEGTDEVCRVSGDDQSFKMTVSKNGNWEILQQVPAWIKNLQEDLGKAIESVYC